MVDDARVCRVAAEWAPELGRVQGDDAAKTTTITLDADRLDARPARALAFLRKHPERAEKLVLNLAVRLELALQVLEVQRRWRVRRTANAAAARRTPKVVEDEVVRRILRGQPDSEIVRDMRRPDRPLDRGKVKEIRERRTRLTPAQVRNIADGI